MTGCRWWRAAVVGGCKSNALSRGDLVTWPISVPPFYQCYPKSYPPPLEPASTASCCTFCSLVPVVFSSSNSCWILPSRVCRFRVVLVQIRTFLDRACLFPRALPLVCVLSMCDQRENNGKCCFVQPRSSSLPTFDIRNFIGHRFALA